MTRTSGSGSLRSPIAVGLVWLARDQSPSDRLVVPTADGVTLPTNGEGEPIELPPSQPAVAVSFGADGQLIRPEPVRARVIDESGNVSWIREYGALENGGILYVAPAEPIPELRPHPS